jgi:hypothetical protein
MGTGYSRSPRLLKGAIIQFSAPLFVPVPNIVVFQYNPETISRSLTPWAPPTKEEMDKDPHIEQNLAQPYDPVESFNIVLELDAADDLEDPAAHPIAYATGIADRLAALETLLYPPAGSTIGGLLGGTLSVSTSGLGITPNASADVVKAERKQVPIVLFWFGTGRILPVRITTMTIDEQAYSPILYPLRAKVTLGMKVLLPESLTDDGTTVYKLAVACYKFTMAQKEALAIARNAENAVDALSALLPI